MGGQASACSCRSLGCLDPQCVLCEHNPHRRCNVNFAPKYLVNDVLKAKCDAPIRVEIIDRQTGVPLGEDIADVHLEGRAKCLCLLLSLSHLSHYGVHMRSMYRKLTSPTILVSSSPATLRAASSVQYVIV